MSTFQCFQLVYPLGKILRRRVVPPRSTRYGEGKWYLSCIRGKLCAQSYNDWT